MPGYKKSITEGLRAGDLDKMISHRFTIDQFRSKLGEDEDVLVLAFRVDEKFAAIDAMEFMEKSYPFILDADISSGEEKDGKYSLFIELERRPSVIKEIEEVLKGIERLAPTEKWRFKYYDDVTSHDYSPEAIQENVPLTSEEYVARVDKRKKDTASKMLNQGTAMVSEYVNNHITFTKPFAESLTLAVHGMGAYSDLCYQIQGGIQLDEAANSQTLFLEKYLGNYEIHKIDGKFLIRNGDQGMLVSKKDWE